MNTKTILERTTSFRDDLLKDLTDTEFAIYYLEAALTDYKEDGNTESLWMALRDVVKAQSEMGNWREYQKERLAKDREAAIDYLQLTLEEYLVDGDLPFFLKGLRTFVESQGGVSELSKRTDIDSEILLEVLSNGDAPLFGMLRTILNSLECRLSIEPQARTNATLETATDSP